MLISLGWWEKCSLTCTLSFEVMILWCSNPRRCLVAGGMTYVDIAWCRHTTHNANSVYIGTNTTHTHTYIQSHTLLLVRSSDSFCSLRSSIISIPIWSVGRKYHQYSVVCAQLRTSFFRNLLSPLQTF